VLHTPFTLIAIQHFDNTPEAMTSFDTLLNKYLITRTDKNSKYYEIHDLVREYGQSQLTLEQKKSAHIQATNYYEALEPKTYLDVIETVYHSLEANLQDRAQNAANIVVNNALHDGLFDLVIDFTSQLLEDERSKSWSNVHFARGRAMRFKLKFTDALKSYETSLLYANDERFIENTKSEIASTLVLQADQYNRKEDILNAKKIYGKLVQSRNVETQVNGLLSLGFLNIKGENKNKGIFQLNQALNLAKKNQLKRHVRQICQALGSVYINMDDQKALRFLEQADTLRQETFSQYGHQDVDANYFLFEAFANVYNALMRFEDAVRASEKCVSIDRKLNLEERLAHSLFQLGKDNCQSKRFGLAVDILKESLSLIRNLNIHGKPETITLEWLVIALWNSQQFEQAIETILEITFINQHTKYFSSRHIIIREVDLLKESNLCHRDTTVHILVLPKRYDINNLKQWHNKIVSRRPELAIVNPVLLYKG
jgi:tetratricopeptide (TPR) repeat protein